MRIHWINENPGAARDEAGYWVSYERRFRISPNYRHTIYPDSYTVTDNMTTPKERTSFDRIRDCKQWAESRVLAEHKKEADAAGRAVEQARKNATRTDHPGSPADARCTDCWKSIPREEHNANSGL
jgi:hypothetical protein